MNKSIVFNRTDKGNELLDTSYGNISGDARRLLALIDGRTSVEEVVEKVPLSVQVQLDAIFAQLLSKRLITEQLRTGGGISAEGPVDAAKEGHLQALQLGMQFEADMQVAKELENESKRRIELEQELDEMRKQLAASKARQKEVEALCHRLEQRVATFEQGMRAELAENRQPLPVDTRIELHDSLDNLNHLNNHLNQALLDQQESLNYTPKLRSFKMQLSGVHSQKKIEVSDHKSPRLPHYEKLRGLEFFKGFANVDLFNFLTCAKLRRVGAGNMILKEGEEGTPLFIIFSGSVDVISKGNLPASLVCGDSFGEFTDSSGGASVRSAQVVATSDCELLVVEPQGFSLASVQLRQLVFGAILHGQVKRALQSQQRIDSLMSSWKFLPIHEPR